MSINHTVILIPAYKPSDALIRVVSELHGRGFSVVCVDDGSGGEFDRVFEAVSGSAEVLRYPVNRGKGGALKYGMDHILSSPAYTGKKYIVTADADGQHRPEDIAKIADAMENSPDALVIGSRHFTGEVPLRSRFGNSVTRIVFAVAGGKKLNDTQTGLRGFSFDHAGLFADTAGNKYEYEMNMLFAAVEEKIPIEEIPIETVYEDGNSSSHFRPLRDSVRIYWNIFLASKSLKYLFSSGLAFIIDYALVLLLDAVIPSALSMEIAMVAAWICSSLTNFFINRNFVFRSDAPLIQALPEYYGLAGVVFLCKAGLLELLTRVLHIPLGIAKLGAEILFFVSNYFIQKKLIFGRKHKT